ASPTARGSSSDTPCRRRGSWSASPPPGGAARATARTSAVPDRHTRAPTGAGRKERERVGTKGWSGAVLAVALLATGCAETDRTEASEAQDPLAVFYGQGIDWQECDGRFECGTFEVPMDYDDPSGRRLEIAVKRLPASGSDRIGSLVVNPGGPGGSGLDYVSAAPAAFSRQVRERFDIVGFDPRGVGQSSPVYCMDSAELDEFLGFQLQSADGTGDPTAATDASVEEFVRLNRDFVEACQERSGELIHHVGTANVARDLDVLREVLGDDGLTYLGKSYGTSIGAHYAELFGANVRALVLDGAVTPHGDQLELSVEQAGGFTTALHAFVEDCLSRPDCPLADGDDATVADGVARIAELLERAAAERSEEHTSELQSRENLVCRLLL